MTAVHPRHETLAASVARLWMRLYTMGLPDATRDRREQQLESDLWEHQVDRLEAGFAPSMLGLEVLGRTVRGMPADLLWRFQLEGPKMNIKIPFERLTGALLLVLVFLLPISGAISGYDTARDGWDDELTRLGDMSGLQINVNIMFQVLTGLGLVAAAAGFYLALEPRAHILATFSAFGMLAAGVLTLAASAAYAALGALAEDYVSGVGGADVLATSRALAIGMDGLVRSGTILLALSVYGLAIIGFRRKLVPRWLGGVAALSFVLVMAGMTAGAGDDSLQWVLVMSGQLLLMLWLIVAGFSLLLARRRAPAGPPPLVPGVA